MERGYKADAIKEKVKQVISQEKSYFKKPKMTIMSVVSLWQYLTTDVPPKCLPNHEKTLAYFKDKRKVS